MKITNQGVAVLSIVLAALTTFTAFFLSRGDHDLKLMSLTAVLSLGSGLMGIAGTLLVGTAGWKAISGSEVPPGSIVTQSSEAKIVTPPPETQKENP